MRALRWTLGFVAAVVLAAALFVLFGLDVLKDPLARRVKEATGRELVIEGSLRPVWSWVHPRFRAERVRISNPAWATDGHLLVADAVEASVSLLPLLEGRVVLPEVHLARPAISLEADAEGRNTWTLESTTAGKAPLPIHIGSLTVDAGQVRCRFPARRVDAMARVDGRVERLADLLCSAL
ncbi:MAG TPA: AsmA family protein [Burkholderiales bacterium]|nr:AsmA family protein [Burkholderiales bacterium]